MIMIYHDMVFACRIQVATVLLWMLPWRSVNDSVLVVFSGPRLLSSFVAQLACQPQIATAVYH